MPKRNGRKGKNRRGGRGGKAQENGGPPGHVVQHHQHHHPHPHAHRHDDEDIPQIPGIPLPHVAALLKDKIAEIEKNQQEAEDEALLNPGESVRRINAWEASWSTISAGAENEAIQEHVTELTDLFHRVSGLFYTTLAERQTLQYNSTKLIKQNETFQELCRRLQAENKSTQKRFSELHEREQVWRKELEDHFQSSLQEIKSKINEHEDRYTKVLEENEELRRKLQEFVDYDNKRTGEFNSYRTQQGRIMDIQEKENESLKIMLENKIKQANELEGNLKEAININRIMKTRQEQTNSQLETYQKTLQDSTRCIDQVKSMNTKTMRANKDLQKQYRELSMLHVDLQKKNSRMDRQIETLSNLSRELSKKNRTQTQRIRELEAQVIDPPDERPDESDEDRRDVISDVVHDENHFDSDDHDSDDNDSRDDPQDDAPEDETESNVRVEEEDGEEDGGEPPDDDPMVAQLY